MQTWNVYLPDREGKLQYGATERVDCEQCVITNDGSLLMANGPNNIKAVYAARYWLKVEPAAIQSGKVN